MKEAQRRPRAARVLGLALCLLFCAGSACAQAPVDLHGTVSYSNRQTYLELPFQVPDRVARLTVELTYTGREQGTHIDLGILDAERFRGWSGGNKSTFTISATDATPSYLPGPIRAGTWRILLGVPNIEPGVTSRYQLHITFDRAGQPPPVSTFSAAPLRTGPAWFRGDLHMHTAHSDGACLSQSGAKVPCPVYKTVEAAAARGLDFIAITDHNTTSHYDAMRELQPFFDRLLLIPGRELTTFDGHGNVFGITGPLPFELTSARLPTLQALLEEVRRQGGLFSINHPGAPTGASCMGCGWSVPGTDYHLVSAIETLNGGSLDGPYSGIPFWEARLNQGYRLPAIGGSDNHDADLTREARSAIGHPTTVVYATELSERAILESIRSGHVFIDVEGTRNRSMSLRAQAGHSTAVMGDAIPAPAGVTVNFSLTLSALVGAHPEVICDGAQTSLLPASSVAEPETTRTFAYTSDGRRHWLAVFVRDPDNHLLLLGNPIYLNY